MRRDLDPDAVEPGALYRLLTAVVLPRPVAWVSTTSAEGVDNLAPHSFFTVACARPPVVQFTSVGRKDSLRNVEATREFVVCLTPVDLIEQVNATATDFGPGTSEFEAVGVEREPSVRVRPPRVARSPVALECRLHLTLGLGDSTIVLGRVVHVAIAEDVLVDDHPAVERLRPVARLGRDEWALPGPTRSLPRIRHADWPEGGPPAPPGP